MQSCRAHLDILGVGIFVPTIVACTIVGCGPRMVSGIGVVLQFSRECRKWGEVAQIIRGLLKRACLGFVGTLLYSIHLSVNIPGDSARPSVVKVKGIASGSRLSIKIGTGFRR